MSFKAICFDLDGTLLPMDQEVFVGDYFKRLAVYLAPYGYGPQELIKAVWKGTAAMIANDGSVNNEEAFWNCFQQIFGKRVLADKDLFDVFYRDEFPKVKGVCGFNPRVAPFIERLKQASVPLILATNPIFPSVATEQRIEWAGLKTSDFQFITTYENSRFCKPNPAYYTELMTVSGLLPENCLMVGNDVGDDMTANTIGMKVFLLTDCLINKENADISRFPYGDWQDFEAFLNSAIHF